MKSYVIQKKGKGWDLVPEIQMEHMPWLPAIEISATAQMCYDDTSLYVRLAAKEANIRAELTGKLDLPCKDSCLEFFFTPIPGDKRYINVEYNPNACMYLGIGTGSNNLVRLMPEIEDLFHAKVTYLEGGWEVVYQIPVSFVNLFFENFVLESGKVFYGNFYKCGELTEKRHFLAWNPITSENPNFHRPCDFGMLILE